MDIQCSDGITRRLALEDYNAILLSNSFATPMDRLRATEHAAGMPRNWKPPTPKSETPLTEEELLRRLQAE